MMSISVPQPRLLNDNDQRHGPLPNHPFGRNDGNGYDERGCPAIIFFAVQDSSLPWGGSINNTNG